MARRQIVVSDLTGKQIDSDNEHAVIRVLDHPLLDHPVKLDAFLLEVANLKESKRELVTLDVVLPDGETERLVMELKDFDKLITAADPDDVLNGAERYYEQAIAPRRRGRPAGSKSKPAAAGPSMSKEQREAIRTWANSNGYSVGDRGRIAANVIAAFEEAHKAG